LQYLSNGIDLIITGEGKLDDQTAHGKLVKGVSQLAQKYQVPVIAICGKKQLIKETDKSLGLNEIIEIGKASYSNEFKIKNASDLIQSAIFKYLKRTI
jgi:glycerate kinase